ncbi:MAG: hypothetical protein Q8R83_05305 [Legionellaceae bacterium]|nr:hypothetical protein [Legionellaceae bacterium]
MKLKIKDRIQDGPFIFRYRQNKLFMASKLLAFILFFSSSIVEYSYAKSNQINPNYEEGISEILPQPIAPVLTSVERGKKITLDWLLTKSNPGWDSPTVDWFDNNHIIYSFESSDPNQKNQIELINIETRACLQFNPDAYVPRLVRGIQTI